MAKNMYQKRKERQERNNAKNDDGTTFPSSNINWDISTYAKPHLNPYGIRKIQK